MPVDKDGTRADIISDPASTISRMNIGRLYEAYITKSARQLKRMISAEIIALDDIDDLSSTIDTMDINIIDSLFNKVLGFLEIIGTEQYTAYVKIKDVHVKRDILKEIVTDEMYVYYSLGSKPAYLIVEELNNSIYKPLVDKIKFNTINGIVESKEDIIIAPLYIMMLAKIADTWLSTSSAKVNHFGLPTSTSKAEKHRLPWRNSATKVLSETESRLYGSYVGVEFLAELKDRGSSIKAHENMYYNILAADNPTNIDRVIDRSIVPYGQDKALEIVNSLFNCAGIEMTHKVDTNLYHN